MSIIERFLLIGLCIAPFVALMFVLPKVKKKQKTFETTDYVPETKVEPVAEVKPEIIEEKIENKSFEEEIMDYRQFLEKRKERMSMPSRVELPKGYNDLTESYSAMRRRMERASQQEKNTNINNLDSEIKALLIAGILDRKF